MGIPIGWNIRRDEAKDKDVLRADVTGHRSPIRRRAAGPRSTRADHDTDYLVPLPSRLPRVEWMRPRARTRLAPPPVPEVSADYHSNESSRNPPTLDERLRERRNLQNRLDGYMRAYETRAAADDERALPALTPGFAPAAALRNAERATSRSRERSSYRRATDSQATRSRSPRADRPARGDTVDALEEGRENNDNNAVSFPTLRRMGRRTIADGPLPASSLRESWSPVSAVDGLGDRERSVSPFDDQLQWDSFLTTVVPDPVAPTAESSFASAAASASFSNSHPSSRAGSSNSAESSQTHLTVPSRRPSPPQNEQFMRACDTSDDDTASDTEEEEMDVRGSIRRLNGTEAFRHRNNVSNSTAPRRRIRPSYFSNEPPTQDAQRYSPRVLERSRDAGNYIRTFYNSGAWREVTDDDTQEPEMSQLDGPTDEPASTGEEDVHPLVPIDAAPLDQELRDARSLLERLSRRGDVSDDFWASVGLTRSFADRVESFQELL